MIGAIELGAVVLAALAASFAGAELVALRARSAPPEASSCRRRVRVLLRPIAGASPWSAAALASSFSAARAGDVVVFSVADERDPAHAVAHEAIQRGRSRAPLVEVRLVVGGPLGPNGKACRLAEPFRRLPDILAIPSGDEPPLIVVADDDVELRRELLDALDAAVEGPAVGEIAAAWAAPVEDRSGDASTLGDRASAAVLDGSAHAFPALGALPTGDAPTFVGKAFAVDARALASIGGFSTLRRHLGEDAELSRRLRAEGLRSALVAVPAVSLARGRSLRAVVARFARWLAVVRAQRPHLLASYPVFLAPLPLVAALTLAAHTRPTLFAAAALVLTRLILSARLHARVARRRSLVAQLCDLFLGDVILLAAWGTALVARSHEWRGRSLTIRRGVLVDGTDTAS